MQTLDLQRKIEKLSQILNQYSGVIVAFSGGTDSVLLLAAAQKVLGKQNVIAATAVSETYTLQEKQRAIEIASSLGVQHLKINTKELAINSFTQNNFDRCYHCKRHRFSLLKDLAVSKGLVLIEGSNMDDIGDYRPGIKAIKELGIKSPLQLANLSKKEIRDISKEWGLPTWNIPSQSCLATRISYGIAITGERLQRIAKAEEKLFALGLVNVRVRDHGEIARIEVEPTQLKLLLENKLQISKALKQVGFSYVTADLDGYVSGSMNRTVSQGGAQ